VIEGPSVGFFCRRLPRTIKQALGCVAPSPNRLLVAPMSLSAGHANPTSRIKNARQSLNAYVIALLDEAASHFLKLNMIWVDSDTVKLQYSPH